ncbi:Rv3235 family protein [Leucobacter sp. USHLN153]|uniref:Rv3235 family protein n=1 Tax=Leucobacter sp. USHLN153 TaxID=3081268 RepID=UPI00301A2A16
MPASAATTRVTESSRVRLAPQQPERHLRAVPNSAPSSAPTLNPPAVPEEGVRLRSVARPRFGAAPRPAEGSPRSVSSDPHTGLEPAPPPNVFIQKLALIAYEVLEGRRSIGQLGAWITPEVAADLRARRALRMERECLTGDRRQRVASPGRAHSSRPAPEVVESTVVLHSEPRSTAVALRFEQRGQRWRATHLTVL